MPFKQLPTWAIESINPAFFDTESKTAIEMVARLHATMRELIDDYNSMVANINTELENYKNETDTKIEKFKINTNKIIEDFIHSVDTKITNQNSEISEAIQYMKDNIVETTQDTVNEAITNGDITVNVNYDSITEGLSLNITNGGGE